MGNIADIDIEEAASSEASHSTLAWVVTLTASLFFFYQFVQLNAFNSLNSFIIPAFHLSAVQVGTLSSLFFYSNILFLFPAGLMLDRFSPRKIITVGLLITATSVLIFAVADTYWLAAVSRLLTGVGSAFCFLSCARIATRWFPPQKMAFVMGVIVTMAMLGGMVAQTPFALLIQATSWRTTLFLDAGMGYIFMLMAWFIIRDYPPNHKSECKHEHAQINKMGVMHSLQFVFKNSQNWICALYASLLNLPIFILGAIWGILYLSQARGFSATDASYATSMLFIGTMVGCPVFGWISDKMKNRKMPIVIGSILSLVTVVWLMAYPHLSLSMVITAFLALGFFTSAQVISYPLIAEHNPLALTSTATSIISFFMMFFGAIGQPLFGWLIGLDWAHHFTKTGTPIYAASEYHIAMWLLPIAFAVSIVISLFIKETRCKSLAEKLPE